MTDILSDYYLWVKSFHVMSVLAWMAGLFYLPRLYVYHVEGLKKQGVVRDSDMDLLFRHQERLLLKANTLRSVAPGEQNLSAVEYAAWAECLMDFDVILPDDIRTHVDGKFIEKECNELPVLKDLIRDLPPASVASSEGGKEHFCTFTYPAHVRFGYVCSHGHDLQIRDAKERRDML